MRASEDKFGTVFHFSPDAIAIIRLADDTFLDVNEAFTKLLGYERAEVVDRVWAELNLCEEPDVPFSIKEALYRVAQEALQNAVKHSRPSRLDVRIDYGPDGLWLEVQNDGVGFDPQAVYPGHLGLRSMRERVMKLGGTLDIASQTDSGTQVRVHVPIPNVQNGHST